jgi:hypothetical protein
MLYSNARDVIALCPIRRKYLPNAWSGKSLIRSAHARSQGGIKLDKEFAT